MALDSRLLLWSRAAFTAARIRCRATLTRRPKLANGNGGCEVAVSRTGLVQTGALRGRRLWPCVACHECLLRLFMLNFCNLAQVYRSRICIHCSRIAPRYCTVQYCSFVEMGPSQVGTLLCSFLRPSVKRHPPWKLGHISGSTATKLRNSFPTHSVFRTVTLPSLSTDPLLRRCIPE